METPQSNRWIIHCDCNSFFASVELLEHPELKAVPVAVCGDPEGRHGIILAKNDAAKAFHVQTAETIWQARAKCPNLTLLEPHHEKYHHYYNIINAIYNEYTNRVEPFSIDESWLDVTQCWHLYAESPKAFGDLLRRRVREATGLTISAGVSFNKTFAKMGSDYKKPDATTYIGPENYQEILWPLPAGDLLFVGKSAVARLNLMGIDTVGAIARADPRRLTEAFGKFGADLSRMARGGDTAEVRHWGESDPIKSVGNQTTYKRDLRGAEICAGLAALSDEVAGRLRRHGLWAGAVQVTIKDTALKSIQRQRRLPLSTHLAREIEQTAWELVRENWDISRPVRLLGVTALSLTSEPAAEQQSLFDDAPKPNPKREALEKSLDAIRGRYGKHAIAGAYVLKNEIGLEPLSIEENPQPEENGPHGR